LVNVGDLVEVRSGELIPVDGIVTEGVGSLDRAPLTGESLPVRIAADDAVEAGLVLRSGPVILRTTAVGDDTRLSNLIDSVRTFRDKPPRLQSSIEWFTAIWVPLVLVGAVLAALFMEQLEIMLLLWVVACPCSLLLAAPVPHATALSNAARTGLVARGGDVLEKMALVNLALLDKTGTLTKGMPRLDDVVTAKGVRRQRAIRLAAGIEARSNHSYAAVVLAFAADEAVEAMQVTKLKDGKAGVSGSLRGKQVLFGQPKWVKEEGVDIPDELHIALTRSRRAGYGASLLVEDGAAIALFTFAHDDIRPGAESLVRGLEELGVEVELLSGDAQEAVEACGKKLGIGPQSCRGEVDPEGKAAWVQRRSLTSRTLMAGDGFNDAAALAAADIGVAVGSGEQVNLDAADVLLPGEDPSQLARLINLARRTRRIVHLNIAISLAVTILLVISVLDQWHSSLALGVFVHELSALLIIINGIWLAGDGASRLAVMWTLMADLIDDTRTAFSQLMLRFSKPSDR
jgi:Cd2+/Zn2+-exporting ATPase